jgi:RHS repeat-associated protein
VVVSDTEAVYLYGLDIIAQQSERLYYFSDGLGSVRQLLDSTGEVEANYAYDPFGVPVVAGDASNPYRFTGEAWDEEVELLYLRARYYQPETGRFITKDPWAGDLWQPSTLNRCVYVTSNPANLVDPSGLQCVGESCPQPAPTPTMGPEPQQVPQPTSPPISPTDIQQDTIDCEIRTRPSIRRSTPTPTPSATRIPETRVRAVGDRGEVLLHQRTVVSEERIMSFIVLFAAREDVGSVQGREKGGQILLPVVGRVKSGLTAMVSTYNNGTYVDVFDRYDTNGLTPFDAILAFPSLLMRSVEVTASATDSRHGPYAFPEGIPARQTGEGHLKSGAWFDSDEGYPSKVVMNLWVQGLTERGIVVTWGAYRLGLGVSSYEMPIPSE